MEVVVNGGKGTGIAAINDSLALLQESFQSIKNPPSVL